MSLSESDIQNIRELSSKFAKNIVEQNFEGVASIYTEDATFMPPGPAVTGRPAIKEWMAAFPAASKFELNIDDIAHPSSIAGIEVYRSGAQVPVRFGGGGMETQCGVIVVWTKVGQMRRGR